MKTENVKFTGMYKIPNTPENVKIIKENILPIYKFVKNENALAFEGEPLDVCFELLKDALVKSQDASKSWLTINAKMRGIELPELNKENLFIISNNDDIMRFTESIKKLSKSSSENLLQKFVEFFKRKPAFSRKLPKHLKSLTKITEYYNKKTAFYKNFPNKGNIVTVNTPQELLTKMMLEK